MTQPGLQATDYAVRLHLRFVEPEDQHGFLDAEAFRDTRAIRLFVLLS